MMLKQTLQEAGFEVVAVVPRGSEAVAISRREAVDVLIMDINLLDETDGIMAATEINSGIPIIYCTAFVDPETLTRAKATAPVAILEKPINTMELLGHLARLAS